MNLYTVLGFNYSRQANRYPWYKQQSADSEIGTREIALPLSHAGCYEYHSYFNIPFIYVYFSS